MALAREDWKARGRRTLADLEPIWSPLRQCAWFGKGRGARQPRVLRSISPYGSQSLRAQAGVQERCRRGGGGRVTHDHREEGRSHIHKKDLTLAGQSDLFLSLTTSFLHPGAPVR